jgi:hypothetical protein
MKCVSPIIVGWVAGGVAASVFTLLVSAVADLQSTTPSFKISDIPWAMLFWFFWISLAMIPGLTAALPIFYLTSLGRTGLSWIVAGLVGICILAALAWIVGILKNHDGDFKGYVFIGSNAFIAASVFWQTAVFLDRHRFALEKQEIQKSRTDQCT